MSDWAWDIRKAEANLRKHGTSFELATVVFSDPFNFSEPDPHPDSNRWVTIGKAGAVILFVSHTFIEPDLEYGRIISARRATAHERKRYVSSTYS
jgi:uncharacterized protein